MTTLSAITAGQIDSESPLDTVLASQWTNNWISAFEGDATASAHRLQGAAIADNAITEGKLIAITAGSSYRYGVFDTEYLSIITGYEKALGYFVIPRSGTYRVTFEIKASGTGNGFARIYKNASSSYSGDVAVGTEQTATGSYVTKTESLTFNAGDVISLYAKITLTATCHVRNFIIASANKQHG